MLAQKLNLEGERVAYLHALFAYFFNRITQREFIEYVGDKEEAQRILDTTRYDAYVLKNCKLYAWAVWCARAAQKPEPKRTAFEVERADAQWLKRLDLSHLDAKFPSYGLEDFEFLVSDTMERLDTHIGKFINGKMHFLIKSYGVTFEAIKGDLHVAALRALYLQFPRYESLLHFENVAKHQIHNTGQTTITYHTAPGRNELQKDAKGKFQRRARPFTPEFDTLEAGPEYMSHLRDDLMSLVQSTARMKPKLQRFMLCCAGHHDHELSTYLGSDNSQLVEDISYSRYLKRVQKFFNYTDADVQRVFSKIRERIVA